VLALGCALLFDRSARRRGLDPPGFAHPARRAAGLAVVGVCLALTSFAPLATLGEAPAEVDFAAVPPWQLFVVHALLALTVVTWFGAGFAGSGASLASQVGLRAHRPLAEIGFGVVFGIGAWFVVLGSAWLIAVVVAALGGDDLLPKRPPDAVVWLVGQSVGLRAALAFSAGGVEEIFFRGLLQPRVGLAVSTALFALAHLAYGQPFLLVGVTLLSVLYGLLVRWRQSVWAAIAAHTVFDLVQLLVVVPALLGEFRGFWAP